MSDYELSKDKQVMKVVCEINRMREAIKSTKSKHLINDYTKSINENIDDLKEYCKYRKVHYSELNKLLK